MLLSVFTPVQRTDYLLDAWRSLLLQDVPWQWVLGMTGGMPKSRIPPEITADKRVKIIRCSQTPTSLAPGIGRAKRECCQASAGDVLVELDHDDILVPGILGTIARLVDRGADFVYSDAAVFRQQSGFPPAEYDSEYGWSSYPVRVFGRRLLANRSFGISARSLADIMFAPDHVRAWKRSAYLRAGGHDPDLPVGDDHDLLCRTYLAGAAMVHTGCVGYLYRWHGQNATRNYNEAIQIQNVKNRDRYLEALIDEWTRRLGLDSVVIDTPRALSEFRPKDGASLGSVKLDRTLELCGPRRIRNLLIRIWRSLAPDGWLTIKTPSSSSKWAYMPHCRSWWNEVSIASLCSPAYWRSQNGPDQLSVPRFQPVRITEKRNRSADGGQDEAPCLELRADLCCIKGQRLAGPVPY